MLARKGQVLGVWSKPSAARREERQMRPLTWSWRALLYVMFWEERCQMFWKNLHWPQITGAGERWSWAKLGRSRAGEQSVRLKYLLLFIGSRQQPWQLLQMWDEVVSDGHYRTWFKAPTYIEGCEEAFVSWPTVINWLATLVSFLHSPAHCNLI